MPRFLTLTLIFFTMAFASMSASAQRSANPSQEGFRRGTELYQKGDLRGARDAYESALKFAPNRVDLLSNLGLVYSQLGQQERAIKCFHGALKIDPQQSSVRLNLGITLMRAEHFDDARTELAKVVTMQPENLLARNLLGLCLLKLDRVEEGIAELEVVHRANPKDMDASYTLTSAYLKTSQLDKAEPIIREMESGDSAQAHFIVGSYYLAKLDHRRAIQDLALAVARDPKLPEAHVQLAYAYFFDFQWDLSVKMCQEELALNPDDSNAVSLLGSIYRQRGRIDEATELLDKAIRLRPDDYEVLYQTALLARAKKDYSQALALLNRVIQLRPDFPPAHITLVRLYTALKRPDDAQREQATVNLLNAQRKNQPTVRDKALYDAFKTPE